MMDAHRGDDDRVAVLGAGIMGSAMARNLLKAGCPTTVWDRSREVSERLVADGAVAAPSPEEAVREARVVITMLPTGDVVESVVLDGRVAEAFAADAMWAQMGTIGPDATARIADRLARLRPDVAFVDAPVSGSKGPAESGQLLILASGPDRARPALERAFAAIGRSTIWVGTRARAAG